jgi:hypothetical protein
MGLSAAYVRVVVGGIGDRTDARQDLTGTGGLIVEESIPDLTEDQLVSLAFALDELQVFVMLSTRALTVKTNDADTPQETLTLAANSPFIYIPGSGVASPFLDDVTALYVSNASGGAATFTVRGLVDATP